MEMMKVRISYDDGPAETEDLLRGLVKFFGGKLVDLSPPGETWVEYEVRKTPGVKDERGIEPGVFQGES